MPFADGTAWFCVRGNDVAAVAALLRLRTAVAANWASGLEGAASGLFVGCRGAFVVAVGRDAFGRGDVEAIAAALRDLSAAQGDAWWFASDAASDQFGWARARGGVVQRAYWFADGDADGDGPHLPRWDVGDIDGHERALAFFVDDPRDRSDDPMKWWPTSGDVLALAARWCFDPRQVAASDGIGNGLLGRW